MSRSAKRDRKPTRPAKPAAAAVSIAAASVAPASVAPASVAAAADEPTPQAVAVASCTNCETYLRAHTGTLEQLVAEINALRDAVRESVSQTAASNSEFDEDSTTGGDPEQIDELLWQIRQRDERLAELERERTSLEQQNGELASKLASQSIRKSVQTSDSSTNDALSWEERKTLILQQMENDSFDTETFVSEIQANHQRKSTLSLDDEIDPMTHVQQLVSELVRHTDELARKNEEIGELHCLLEQQGGVREGGLAIGAASIAQMMDADELVSEERERLKQLQAEWEEKFRQGEITASLERATLSRERQELAKKQAELEEQLAHMRREVRQSQETPSNGTGPSRRWLQKLGLAESGLK